MPQNDDADARAYELCSKSDTKLSEGVADVAQR